MMRLTTCGWLAACVLAQTFAGQATHAAAPEKAEQAKKTVSTPARLTKGIFEATALPGIVVDDRQAELKGEWKRSQVVVPFVADGYLHDNNEAKGEKSASYSAKLPASGEYEVRMYFSATTNRASNTPVTLETATGSVQLKVNQRQTQKENQPYHILGTFAFAAEKPAVVVISNTGTDGHVIIDAIQFIPVGEVVATNNTPNTTPAVKPETPAIETKPVVQLPKINTKELDALVTAELGDEPVTEVMDDEAFLRRATLDLIGKQPTPEELQAFAKDKSPTKRAEVIERLLASTDFGKNWANYWTDTISYRVPPPELTFLIYDPFKQWLADHLNQGTAWDQITREILTATGKVGETPAATFVGYHQANPTRLAAETARIFLGQQIRCAECHDHPFDHWKREEFHQLTAFFARTQAKLPWNDGTAVVVSDRGKGEYIMPNAEDPKKKGTVMTPVFLQDPRLPEGAADLERRQALAQLITSPNNPWFAQSYVNRIWARLMGRGFYEPVDDMADHQAPLLPQVHQALSNSFTAHGFDVKHVFRVVMKSQAYQRRLSQTPADVEPFTSGNTAYLRGDEVFDSLVSAIGLPNVVGEKKKPTADIRFPPPPKSTRELVAEVFGYDPSLAKLDIPRTMSQAMMMMNNDQINAQLDTKPESQTQLAKLVSEMKDDRQLVIRLYQNTLGRQPSERELDLCLQHMESVGDRRAAVEDLQWSLLNSAEFTTRK